MTIAITRDRLRDLTIFTAVGELTFEAQMSVLRKFYGETPTANVIWDFRKVAGRRLSAEELSLIVAYVKKHGERRIKGKTALVASQNLDFGLSRMSEAYAEMEGLPWTIRSFPTMEDAIRWIDEK